jgi:hypothetical protein
MARPTLAEGPIAPSPAVELLRNLDVAAVVYGARRQAGAGQLDRRGAAWSGAVDCASGRTACRLCPHENVPWRLAASTLVTGWGSSSAIAVVVGLWQYRAPAIVGRTVTFTADPRVDAYIDALPQWQQAICREVRELVHAADPEVVETIKRTVQPYFVLEGNICALLAAKDHVNMFLYDGGIVPDPEGIITGGHDNRTARTVAVREGETLNARALSAMFKQIIANNRAGGWRKLKARS